MRLFPKEVDLGVKEYINRDSNLLGVANTILGHALQGKTALKVCYSILAPDTCHHLRYGDHIFYRQQVSVVKQELQRLEYLVNNEVYNHTELLAAATERVGADAIILEQDALNLIIERAQRLQHRGEHLSTMESFVEINTLHTDITQLITEYDQTINRIRSLGMPPAPRRQEFGGYTPPEIKDKFEPLLNLTAVTELGDLKLIFIDTPKGLEVEGKIMNHCVSSYAGSCSNGSCWIYRILYKDQHVGTLELGKGWGRKEGVGISQIRQIRGPWNRSLDQEIVDNIHTLVRDSNRLLEAK
jgi:hypothetical protein